LDGGWEHTPAAMSAAQSPSSLDALLDGVLKRLTPLVKPFHDSKSGAFKTTTALDTALVWTYKWTRGLRRQRNTVSSPSAGQAAVTLDPD
jgi:hypothetical protein